MNKVIRKGSFISGETYDMVESVTYKGITYAIGDKIQWYDGDENEVLEAVITDILLIGDKKYIEFITDLEYYGRVDVESLDY